MIIVGIDPGAEGAAVQLRYNKDNGEIEWLHIYKGKDVFNGDWIYGADYIFVEHVHAVPRSSAGSTFNFGCNFGRILGIIQHRRKVPIFFKPYTWQKKMFGETKGKTTKEKSLKVAKAWAKKHDIIKPKDIGTDHNKSDALLIALYGLEEHCLSAKQ